MTSYALLNWAHVLVMGYWIGSDLGLVLIWLASTAWFGFMWLTHLRRDAPAGRKLARMDWRSR